MIKVLDHGFVRVVDKMGDDAAIVQAARVSYANAPAKQSDTSLIRYLMRHNHTSPFEMCEIKLHIKAPIFVARQWMRHRMASINEVSGRYSVLPSEFFVPESVGGAPLHNKQGRGQDLGGGLQVYMESAARGSEEAYAALLAEGVAPELARIVLPLSTYTEWYWKIDLHNLMHFLRLRDHPHAQAEIRAYASVIGDIVGTWCPVAWAAFRDYRVGGITLSAEETRLIRDALRGADGRELVEDSALTERERQEFLTKLGLGREVTHVHGR